MKDNIEFAKNLLAVEQVGHIVIAFDNAGNPCEQLKSKKPNARSLDFWKGSKSTIEEDRFKIFKLDGEYIGDIHFDYVRSIRPILGKVKV